METTMENYVQSGLGFRKPARVYGDGMQYRETKTIINKTLSSL